MYFYAFLLAQDVIVDRNKNTLAQEGDLYEITRHGSLKLYLLSIVGVLKLCQSKNLEIFYFQRF